jgi:hypothetical protein
VDDKVFGVFVGAVLHVHYGVTVFPEKTQG